MDPAARRRRRQRHRTELMSGFAVITLVALLAIAWMVVRLGKQPSTARLSAATSSSPPAALNDSATGLSYELLPSPWRDGCPMRGNPVSWTSGEGAVAGHVVSDGHTLTWDANACSGLLPEKFRNSDLAREATKAAAAIDTDRAIRHHRTVTSSTAMRVGGQQAWVVEFDVRFPGQHLAWSSEAGAVVVVDRGNGRAPVVFYVSVPSNLGTASLRTLISSLR
jgi:hypothetical protein